MPRVAFPPKMPGQANVPFDDARLVVVVGANGAGKSRLGTFVERQAGAMGHRIAAQRSLSVPIEVQPRNYRQAESQLRNGIYRADWNEDTNRNQKFTSRWQNSPETHLLNDYEQLLELLFADEARRNRQYTQQAQVEVPAAKPAESKLETLSRLWAEVMPQRRLVIGDDRISAEPSDGQPYEARHMSDGERVTIYLIGQVICAASDSVLVIDEPELHLHRAIHSTLWDRLERERPDCAFVYLTHDLDFAASRGGAKVVWVKSFDGTAWTCDDLPRLDEIPDVLAMQIFGSRRPILFVEGDVTSLDTGLYSLLYPEKFVVPRGSCGKVIESFKSFGDVKHLHNLEVSGIADRDRRGGEEIAALEKSGLTVLKVAEIESALCLSLLIDAVVKQLKVADADQAPKAAATKAKVFEEAKKALDQQASQHALAEIQFRMNGFAPKPLTETAIANELTSYMKEIDVPAIVAGHRARLESVINAGNYDALLATFNCKGILPIVANSIGVNKDLYVTTVTGLLRGAEGEALRKNVRTAIGGDLA